MRKDREKVSELENTSVGIIQLEQQDINYRKIKQSPKTHWKYQNV